MFSAELRERSSKDGMSHGSLVDHECRKIKKSCALNNRDSIAFIHEMFLFMPLPPWIVDGLVRRGCRYSHEN